MYDLEKFKQGHELSYNIALLEMKAGHKRSHWIWYIFPQMIGLGSSYYSNYYGIESLDMAKAYYDDEYLHKHLIEITEVLLNINETRIENIMPFPDDLKLKSSMTLFYLATKDELFKRVLDKYYNGELDNKTVELVEKNIMP